MPTQFLGSGASVVQWKVRRSPSTGLLDDVLVRVLPVATDVLSAARTPGRRGVPGRGRPRLVTEAWEGRPINSWLYNCGAGPIHPKTGDRDMNEA
ncbi:hypothetical protein VR45_25915 [Streptomyces sp. NRRL S-495]|nr:hypothetical protein VR45_25915 [Streptomyces sp. NRRL S-495]